MKSISAKLKKLWCGLFHNEGIADVSWYRCGNVLMMSYTCKKCGCRQTEIA